MRNTKGPFPDLQQHNENCSMHSAAGNFKSCQTWSSGTPRALTNAAFKQKAFCTFMASKMRADHLHKMISLLQLQESN